MVWIIIIVGLTIVCSASMAMVWLLKWRRFLHLMLSGAVGAAAACGFLALAGTAMATSVQPRDALIRGVMFGFFAGLVWSAVLIGILKINSKLKGRVQ